MSQDRRAQKERRKQKKARIVANILAGQTCENCIDNLFSKYNLSIKVKIDFQQRKWLYPGSKINIENKCRFGYREAEKYGTCSLWFSNEGKS